MSEDKNDSGKYWVVFCFGANPVFFRCYSRLAAQVLAKHALTSVPTIVVCDAPSVDEHDDWTEDDILFGALP